MFIKSLLSLYFGSKNLYKGVFKYFCQYLMSFFFFFTMILAISTTLFHDVSAQVGCPQNLLINNDLVGIDKVSSNGYSYINLYLRDSFGGIPTTGGNADQFNVFIDIDQNINTGDARPGGLHGVDARIDCIILIEEAPVCYFKLL